MKITQKFRPGSDMTRYRLKERLKGVKTHSLNWHGRVDWYPAAFKPNHKVIFKQFSKLHYLACHSPVTVSKKWHSVYNRYTITHFGDTRRASCRYLNKWSCHSWL